MYGQGSSAIVPVAGAVLGASTMAVLPQTGMTNAVQIAIAAAAGLVVWAVLYVGMAKFGKR